MNLVALQRNLRDHVKLIYAKRFPRDGSAPTEESVFTAALAKAKRVQQRVNDHADLMGWRAKRDRMLGFLHSARRDLDDGKLFVAFDVERIVDTTEITEVGITLHQGGVTHSMNYWVEGRPRPKGPFEFGATNVKPLNEIIAILTLLIDRADILVGHSLHEDFDTLRANGFEFTPKFVFDTGKLSTYLMPRPGKGPSKLVEIAARYGVETKSPHVGGNDARYSMDTLLAIVAVHA